MGAPIAIICTITVLEYHISSLVFTKLNIELNNIKILYIKEKNVGQNNVNKFLTLVAWNRYGIGEEAHISSSCANY